jgi:hypothetical protein
MRCQWQKKSVFQRKQIEPVESIFFFTKKKIFFLRILFYFVFAFFAAANEDYKKELKEVRICVFDKVCSVLYTFKDT